VQGTDIPGHQTTAMQTFTIVPPPPPPICQPVQTTTGIDTPIVVHLSCASSSGAVTYAIDTGPGHGMLSAINQTDGDVTYVPPFGYSGPDSFTYGASAAGATSASQTVTITMSNPIPGVGPGGIEVSRLHVSATRFTAAASGGPITAVPKPSRKSGDQPQPTGTTVTYTDTKAATMKFTVLEMAPGIRAKGRCVAPPRKRSKHAKAKACTRLIVIGSFSRRDTVGTNSFRFTGRLHGHKLKPSKYRLQAQPTLAGTKGTKATTTFTIIA
jgi:hypothetical protein